MENLRPEVSKLSGLFEVQLVDRLCMLHHTWVIIVHTVDVCPYLYLISVYGSSDKRCCIVRASALQIVHLAIGVAAYESLCDIYLVALLALQYVIDVELYVHHVRLLVLVCAHEVESWYEDGLYPLLLEVGHNHVC